MTVNIVDNNDAHILLKWEGMANILLTGPSPLHSDFRFRMRTHCSLFASERLQIVYERSRPKLMHSYAFFIRTFACEPKAPG